MKKNVFNVRSDRKEQAPTASHFISKNRKKTDVFLCPVTGRRAHWISSTKEKDHECNLCQVFDEDDD